MLSSSAMGVGRCISVPDACRRTCGSAAGVERTRRQAMLRGLLISTSALALVLTFAMEASANPKNKFGDGNVATADAVANANANGGNGGEGGGARSEERGVGKECVGKCRSRWSQ